MVYSVVCTANCGHKFSPLKFQWRMRLSGSNVYENLKTVTDGYENVTLVRHAKTLSEAQDYEIEVQAWNLYQANSSFPSTEKFLVNGPPHGGTCTVYPLTGIAMDTKFTIACINWKQFNVTVGSLSYEYRVREFGSRRASLLFYGDVNVSPLIYFPVGSPQHDFKAEAFIYVRDSLGAEVTYTFPITVKPPLISALNLTLLLNDTVLNPNNTLQTALNNGDQQAAATNALSILSIMNSPNADAEQANETKKLEFENKMTQIRESMVQIVYGFNVSTPVELEQTTNVLQSVVLTNTQLSVNSQEMATAKHTQVGDLFVVMRSKLKANEKEIMESDLVACGSNIWQGSVHSVDKERQQLAQLANMCSNNGTLNTNSSYCQQLITTTLPTTAISTLNSINITSLTNETLTVTRIRVKAVIDSVLKTVDLVTEAVLNDSTSGNYSFEDKAMAAMGTKLNNTSQKQSFQSQLGSINISFPEGCAALKMIISANDPYIWSSTTSEVKSNFLLLEKKGCRIENGTNVTTIGRRRKRSVASTDSNTYDVTLPAKKPTLIFVNSTPENEHLMFYHSFNYTNPSSPIQVIVIPDNVTHDSFEIYIQSVNKPTPTSFIFTTVAPNYTQPDGTVLNPNSTEGIDAATSFFLPRDFLNSTVEHHVGIRKLGCKRDGSGAQTCPSAHLMYNFTVVIRSCQMWVVSKEKWESVPGSDCEILPTGTPTKPVFRANLFGSLGTGLNLTPNTIDFGTLFDNWQGKLAESAAVVATVAALWCIFIPLAVILRRFDKKDLHVFAYLPVIGDFGHKHRYLIDVYTGSKKGNGTKAQVLLSLVGVNSADMGRELADGERENYLDGAINHFSLTCEKHLGDIKEIIVSINSPDKNVSLTWFLSKIVITDTYYNAKYFFIFDDWLYTSHRTKKQECIQLANRDDLAYSKNIIKNNMSRQFQDDHLWVSLAKRKTETNFTRLQRLGVCFNILFMTLIANAMFYGVGGSADKISIGPIKLSVNAIFTSILGALCVVPVTIAITFLFLKSKKDKIKKDEETDQDQDTDSDFEDIFEPLNSSFDHPNDSVTTPLRKPVELRAKKNPFLLPRWCQYIGWVLVAGSMIGAGVFIVFYAMSWGKEKSEEWLASIFLSLFQSLIIIQPLKVLMVAVVLTIIFRKDYDVNNDEFIRIYHVRNKEKGIIYLHELEQEEQNNTMRKLAKQTTMEIVLTCVFLALLYCICYGNIDSTTFIMHKNIINHVAEPNYDGAVTYSSLTRHTEVYDWIRQTLLPSMYPENATNGMPLTSSEKLFIADMAGYRLGHMTMRQLKIFPLDLTLVGKSYEADYSKTNDDRRCFYPGWQDLRVCNVSGQMSALDLAFMGLSADIINSLPTQGRKHDYSGGGYVAVFPNDLSTALTLAQQLKENNWISNYTRALFIEFDLFYPNQNMFTSAIFTIEFHPHGGTIQNYKLYSTRLYRYVGAVGVFALTTEILAMIIVLVFIIRAVIYIKNDGMVYLKSIWNIYHLVCLLCMIAGAVCYVLRSNETVKALNAMQNTESLSTNLRPVMFYNELFFLFLAVTTFLTQISFLNLVRFSKQLGHLLYTLKRSVSELTSFIWVFLICFLAFTFAHYFLLFKTEEPYKTLWLASVTQLSAMLGKFDVQFVEKHGALHRTLFMGYIGMSAFIIVNMFVAILNDSYAESKDDDSMQENFQIIDYIHQSIVTILFRKPQYNYESYVNDDNNDEQDPMKKLNAVKYNSNMKSIFSILHNMIENEAEDELVDSIILKKITLMGYKDLDAAVVAADMIYKRVLFNEELNSQQVAYKK